MWLAVHFLVDQSKKRPFSDLVFYGPFSTKIEAEEWSEKFLPGTDAQASYLNSPFFDEKLSEMAVQALVKK